MTRRPVGLAACAAALWLSGCQTVEKEELTPPSTPVEGAQTVCFIDTSFQMEPGEEVVDLQLGVHTGSLTIDGPLGRYQISESDVFATPQGLGPVVFRSDTRVVQRQTKSGAVTYAVFGKPTDPEADVRLLVWVSGDALDGSLGDSRIFERVRVGDPLQSGCKRRFVYGWFFE